MVIGTSPIHFTAEFSEPVTDFRYTDTEKDVLLSSTAPDNLTCTIVPVHVNGKLDGTVYDVAVSGMSVTSQIVATINPGVAHDAAGNVNRASTSSDNVVLVVFDRTAPTVTINQAATQADPSNLSTVHFTAVFSKAVADFSAGAVSFAGSTATGTLTAVVTAIGTDQKTYDIAVKGMTGNGIVVATIPAGGVHDSVGNVNVASTSTDNRITYAKPIDARYDFGTSSSPVETQYTQVTSRTKFTTKLGYGWRSGTIYESDAVTGSALDSDCNYTKNGTFVMNVPKGTYVVSMDLGRSTALTQMGIYLEGTRVDVVNTDANQVVQRTYTGVIVTDGQLTVTLKGLATKTPWTAIAGLTITQTVQSMVASPNSGKASSAKSTALTDANLKPIVAQAIAEWSALGVSQDVLSAMANASVVIKDLPGSELGLTSLDTVIIDRNAAGYGWFIDPTPSDNKEFQKSSADGQLHALDPKAVDRMDLLTVVAHELGHIAGLDDIESSFGSLMNRTLSKGVRRTAGASETDSLFANGKLDAVVTSVVGPSPSKAAGLNSLN